MPHPCAGPATGRVHAAPRSAVVPSASMQQRPQQAASSSQQAGASQASMHRRSIFLGGAAVVASGLLAGKPALAEGAAPSAVVYEDALDKFNLAIPQGWANGEGRIDGPMGAQATNGQCRAHRSSSLPLGHSSRAPQPSHLLRPTLSTPRLPARHPSS